MRKRGKVVKVPVILQMEAVECGAASLAMILAYYHKWVPLDQVRTACSVSRDGSNARSLVSAAKNYGLTCKAHWYSVEALREKVAYPAILFWKNCHFVVLDGIRGDYVYLNDPAHGRVRMPVEEFGRFYSGACFEFETGPEFVADGTKPNTWYYLKNSIRGNVTVVALAMVLSALVMFSGLFPPIFSRIFTDELLSGKASSWYPCFLWCFAGVALFQLLASVLYRIFFQRATAKIAGSSNVSFLHHVLRLPQTFFGQRTAGDLAGRQAANDSAAASLIGELSPMLMNLVMLVFYLFVMLQYSVTLTVIGVGAMGINLWISRIIADRRTEIAQTIMRDQAKLDAVTVAGIEMVESVKASGAENGLLERWSGIQAEVVRSRMRYAVLNRFPGTLPSLIQQLSSIAVLIPGVLCIMDGRMTAGILLAFQACMVAFAAPVNRVIAAGQSLQEMRASLERIDDVMKYPEDTCGAEDPPEGLENARKLSGAIELRHVTFGYSKSQPPLIEDLNLTVRPGERIALVGGSGSGKSTIAALLTGLCQPWSGEILYDGKPLSDIPRSVLHGSLAMVDQQVVLFQDTVANNIRMWDETIQDFDVILAARDAGIYDDVIIRKDGFRHVLAENGKDLSGGQRQRIEIARVLAGDPSIVILDEATSALDAQTEYDVARDIHRRGITSIMIAHRLSTVRDCDQILVLERGKVIQRGTHEDLIAQEGLYRSLVTTG